VWVRRNDGFVKRFGTRDENERVLDEKWSKRTDFEVKNGLFESFVITT